MMKEESEESAKRTIENSPAIYRWDGAVCSSVRKSAKRTAENPSRVGVLLPPVSRACEFIFASYPAVNCWAIVDRPLRGLE
jgi:hypothetical protein